MRSVPFKLSISAADQDVNSSTNTYKVIIRLIYGNLTATIAAPQDKGLPGYLTDVIELLQVSMHPPAAMTCHELVAVKVVGSNDWP